MVVYIVYRDYDTEGYGPTLAVFSTEEKAEEYVKLHRAGYWETWVIHSMWVDRGF